MYIVRDPYCTNTAAESSAARQTDRQTERDRQTDRDRLTSLSARERMRSSGSESCTGMPVEVVTVLKREVLRRPTDTLRGCRGMEGGGGRGEG